MSAEVAQAQSPSPSGGSGAAYFVDQKKGEVNELKQLLKNLSVERDMKRKRDIIKKVIAYMTLGIDVSRLFVEMVMAVEIKDVVIKKMVYLYLCHYAHANPELGIMCINTLQRECNNEDPMVRGLALRAMTSLGMTEILEYVEQPLKKSLNDISAYVRKTAVMGILKLHYLDADFVAGRGYSDMLTEMLDDVDGMVVTNTLSVIDEMTRKEGGIQITQKLVFGLLARLGEFSEWGLCTVLDLVCRYKPSGVGAEEEIFALMNLLDPILRTANSAAVLATIKCFTHLCAGMEEVEAHLYQRTKAPILTLVTGGNPEVQFAMLRHLDLILRLPNAQGVFEDEYRLFFVRYNDPNYVAQLKVQLISLLANDENAHAIAEELSEYVRGTDNVLSRLAVTSIAEVAMRLESVSEALTTSLVEFVDFGIPHVLTESIKELSNVVRVHTQLQGLMLSSTSRIMRKLKHAQQDLIDRAGKDKTDGSNPLAISQVDVNEAMASLIWVVGEFGETLVEAPYMLEPLIDNYESEESSGVKAQLLVATMKLFFKRPPELQAMLGRLLSAAVNDTSNQDVHDRALLYYRLLQGPNGVAATQILFNRDVAGGGLSVGVDRGMFAENDKTAFLKQMMPEFNTISVMFGCPSEHFLGEKFQATLRVYDGATDPTVMQVAAGGSGDPGVAGADAVNLLGGDLYTAPSSSGSGSGSGGGGGGLLDMDDPLAFIAPSGRGATAGADAVPGAGAVAPTVPGPEVDAETFQDCWANSTDVYGGSLAVPQLAGKFASSGQVPAAEAVEAALGACHMHVVASGALDGPNTGFKFFFYAHHPSGALQLLQLTVENVVGLVGGVLTVTAEVKQTGGDRSEDTNAFVNMLAAALNVL